MPDSVLPKKPNPDALEVAIEALEAQETVDEMLVHFAAKDGAVSADAITLAKARALRLREAALARAYPRPAFDRMVDEHRGKVVKGS